MAAREATEARLVREWLAGSRDSLGRLLEAYYPYVLKLCSLMAGDRREAEEWSQDALLAVALHLGRFDRTRPFKPWLRQVVLNVCRNRRQQTRRRAEWETSLEQLAAAGQAPEHPAGGGDGTVEERLVLQEGLRAVGEAWAALPEEWRTALWLRAVEGLSYGEIAAAGAWPEGTAKTYVFRARQALRQALFEDAPAVAKRGSGGSSHGYGVPV
ncbi:MAG: sigma-70 family RNA polymerase sigma factor [Limnochordaceae bacterium]|nr:sigma-70 family RNA polymerase sigma factor [Limnochordaceae bacterium]